MSGLRVETVQETIVLVLFAFLLSPLSQALGPARRAAGPSTKGSGPMFVRSSEEPWRRPAAKWGILPMRSHG